MTSENSLSPCHELQCNKNNHSRPRLVSNVPFPQSEFSTFSTQAWGSVCICLLLPEALIWHLAPGPWRTQTVTSYYNHREPDEEPLSSWVSHDTDRQTDTWQVTETCWLGRDLCGKKGGRGKGPLCCSQERAYILGWRATAIWLGIWKVHQRADRTATETQCKY